MIMADELLAAAAERQAEKIDETLLFEACALAAQRRNRVKSGPRRNSNDIARWSNMKLPVKSAGSRSGVKLRPLELQAENLACLARAITVLATGTSSISTCPSARIAASRMRRVSPWPDDDTRERVEDVTGAVGWLNGHHVASSSQRIARSISLMVRG